MMKRCSILLLAALGVSLLTTPSYAQDSATLDRNYLALKLMLGLGGSGSVETDSVSFGNVNVTVGNPGKNSAKLLPSYGLAAQYMLALHRYFALGGQLGLMTWKTGGESACLASNAGTCAVTVNGNSNASRNLDLDLDVVPQGRLPISNTFELYLSLPIGLTLDFWNQPEASTSITGIASADVKTNTALGFNVSLLAGARFALAEHFGLFTEVGFTHRQFSHEVTTTGSLVGIAIPSAKANAHLTLDQFAWNIGAFF